MLGREDKMSARTTLPVHVVRAFNTAATSENKIHDDAVAQKFGFTGALVPGVEVYAYMAHMPVARWGRAWLDSGEAECRFLKPVYDGKLVDVKADSDGDALKMTVTSDDVLCATGRASMAAPAAAPAYDSLPLGRPPTKRPKASDETLAPGFTLGVAPVTIDRPALAKYLEDVGETDAIYLRENLVHPGQILRLCNAALVQNVVLGPWIHVGSKVRNHAAAKAGDELSVRSRITSNSVSKGHAIVEFDALIVANATKVIAKVVHTAIWRPRHVVEAG
jgi:acyl dehydratase